MEPFWIVWAVGSVLAIPPWAQICRAGIVTQLAGIAILLIALFM